MNQYRYIKSIQNSLVLLGCMILYTSCTKYLDAKSNISLQVPSTVGDLQALLNYDGLNQTGQFLDEESTDDYFLTYSTWQSASLGVRQNYTWDKEGKDEGSWNVTYQTVYQANVVLDNLNTVSLGDSSASVLNSLKGAALFYRSFAFFNLAQMYCNVFKTETADKDKGICLRLQSSISIPSVRSTVRQTYDQIINDLKSAADLLPVNVPYLTQPSKPAAYAVLARVYLSMSDYAHALLYADSALQLRSTLMDYNDFAGSTAAYPFPRFNQETLFYSVGIQATFLSTTNAKVDSTIYSSYDANDLRKQLFFKSNSDGTYGFKGNYAGVTSGVVFRGPTVDELYLIKAECYARNNQVTEAMDALNGLLEKRYVTGTFAPLTAANANDALTIILAERRKELLFRALRWQDLRRLNLDPARAVTLTRVLDNQVYTLPPNDLRYVILIPQSVIDLSGIEQNPR